MAICMPGSIARIINHLDHLTSGRRKKESRYIKLVILSHHERKYKD